MNNRPNRLREFREGAGFTLVQLAARTGKAFQTISEYETGKQKMPQEFLMKAAEALKRSPEEILAAPLRPLTLNEEHHVTSKDTSLRMLELERREFIAAIAWLVEREAVNGDLDKLIAEVRRAKISVIARNMITSAINVATDKIAENDANKN